MEEKIKTLKIIHLAICAGMILAYLFAGNFSIEQLKGKTINSDDFIFLTIPIIAFFLSNFIFKTQLKQIDSRLDIEVKLPLYQSACIIRWAILEGAAFLILFMKSDLLIIGIILISYLIYLRPTDRKIINDLKSDR